MKKILLLTVVLGVCFPIKLYSVSAFPRLVEVRQPDGYTLKVRMMGDEFCHWMESEDGYTLLYDRKGFLTLAEHDHSGDLQPSRYRFMRKEDRTSILESKLKTIGKHATFSRVQQAKARQNRQQSRACTRSILSSQPVIGKRNYLVILMEFPDVKFTHTPQEFHALMNEKGYTTDGNQGSVYDFYYENSFGQLELQSDVAGIYQAKHEMAYYGDNAIGEPQELAIEAMEAASKDFDLKKYDNDNDGYIDGIHIIFSGYGEESGGGADCIWAHEFRAPFKICTIDDVKMNSYSCSPELRGSSGTGMSYIGVICHEIGHALGAPDYYDVDYATGGQYDGTGEWDVMGQGSWNGDGACPAHFNPFTKINDFKWSSMTNGNKAISTNLKEKTKDQFIYIETKTDGEIFILEYRRQTGFDSCLPGHGLLVWRASDFLSKSSSNTVNATHEQQLYPVAANSPVAIPNNRPSSYGVINSSSTPFPGTNDKTEFTDETTPSMKSWMGENTDYPITNIVEHESDGYIEFDINGGDYGNAYALLVTEPTMNKLKVIWQKPQPTTKVMILCNETDEFGYPELTTYTVGDQVEGGGKVVYVGTDTEFLHTGLKEHTVYYYRLCTWHEGVKAWTINGSRTGKTKTGIVNTFPFEEDFEGEFDDEWEEEIILGSQNHWVARGFYIINYGQINTMLFDPKDGFTGQASRLILPIMNLEGKKNVSLSFDYRNWVQSAKVMYRVSQNSPWKLLKQLDNHYRPGANEKDFLLSNTHIDILLPELSNEYQICFYGDFHPRDNGIGYLEKITLDNLSVSTNVSALIITKDISAVGMSTAQTSYDLKMGDATLLEAGVEYSMDQETWNKVPSATNQCNLNGLSPWTDYYVRAYANTSNGVVYGQTKTFRTLPAFSAGNGTKDDPFQISSIEDYDKLRMAVLWGNECDGLYFILKNSLTVTINDINNIQYDVIQGTFSGVLDGNGNTLSCSTAGIIKYLILRLGPKGEIYNLKLTTGALVDTNKGYIHDCEVNFTQDFSKSDNSGIFGFLACHNYGSIHSCRVRVTSATFTQGYVGGICGYNYSIISNCTFEGNMSVNNNAHLGGIAALNYYAGTQYGTITQCVNKGKLSTKLIDGRAWYCYIGGIAGGTYGTIDQCINDGEITIGCSSDGWDESLMAGGIVGSTSHRAGLVSDCYNCAAITTSFNNGNTSNCAGGIVGEHYLGNIRNCLFLNEVTSTTDYANQNHAIVGNNKQATVTHCFFTGSVADGFAKKVNSTELASQAFIDEMNKNTDHPAWLKGTSHPILMMETDDDVIYIKEAQNISSVSATISGFVAGDIKSCGFEWRKEGKNYWNQNPIKEGRMEEVKLKNLIPGRLYEYRLFAQTANGVKYSPIKYFATEFANSGTQDNPILLNDLYELRVFRQTVHQGNQYGNQYIKLMTDLDLQGDKGVIWEPISQKTMVAFSGDFDGNGHIISNMKIVKNAASAGFFGTTWKCHIHDLAIVNGVITSSDNVSTGSMETLLGNYVGGVGGILGDCIAYDGGDLPLVERCSFTGSIEGGNCTGGIVGDAMTYEVSDCYANALIWYEGNSSTGMGGVVGKGNVTNCYFAGSITTPNLSYSSKGGLTGDYTSIVTNSYYQETDENFTIYSGTPLSEEAMKDGTLLSKFSEEIWAPDNIATPVNQGYPVLRTQSAPHLLIRFYEIVDDSHIRVDGFFYGTDKDYATRGIEYSFNSDKTNPVQIVAGTSLEFSAVIPYIEGKYIAFRAFARENDGIAAYSEWSEIKDKDYFVPGDADGDGVADEDDIVEIRNYIMGHPSGHFIKSSADANGDNVINVADMVTIVNTLVP